MRMFTSRLLLVGLLGAILLGLFCGWYSSDSPDYRNYKLIQTGMSIEEVQAILGPGTEIDSKEVPGVVVPVDPDEARASYERANRVGTIPTARDYRTRIKPVVEGDYVLRWVNSRTFERILVAFRDGKVSEKHCWDPNYL